MKHATLILILAVTISAQFKDLNSEKSAKVIDLTSVGLVVATKADTTTIPMNTICYVTGSGKTFHSANSPWIITAKEKGNPVYSGSIGEAIEKGYKLPKRWYFSK